MRIKELLQIILVFVVAIAAITGVGHLAGQSPLPSSTSNASISTPEAIGSGTSISVLRAALDKGGPATIAFIGTSITQGVGATAYTSSWPAKVTSALQRAYGYGGQGFCDTLDSTINASGCLITLSGSWTTVQGIAPSQTISPAFGLVKSNGAGGTATTTFAAGGDSIDLLCEETTDSSAGFAVTIDGASVAAACAANAGSPTIVKVTYSGLDPKKTHTIVATAPNSGNGYLFGWLSYLSTGGVVILNTGQSGAASDSISTAAKVAWLGQVSNLAAIFVEIAQNDADHTGATTVANLAALKAEAVSLGVPIIYVITEQDSSNNTATWGPALKSWASANGYLWVSVADYWGTYAAGNTAGLYSDTVHPSQAGHYSIANLILNQLRLTPPLSANAAPWPFPLPVVITPSSDVLCAHAGDTSNSLTCNNASTDDTATDQLFSTSYTYPAGLWQQGRILQVCGTFAYWSSTAVPNYLLDVWNGGLGGTQLYGPSGSLTPGAGKTSNGFTACWQMISSDTGAHVFTQPFGAILANTALSQQANGIAQSKNLGSGSATLNIGWQWTSNTGIKSGTYTSGITATGTTGQTCALSSFNNGNTNGTATIALTGTNAIAGGTALTITNTGYGSTSAATSATAGNGTATCSGTATISTTLGGAQGNQVKLQALSVSVLN